MAGIIPRFAAKTGVLRVSRRPVVEMISSGRGGAGPEEAQMPLQGWFSSEQS